MISFAAGLVNKATAKLLKANRQQQQQQQSIIIDLRANNDAVMKHK